MSEQKPLHVGIREWPPEDRPREKLFREGEHCLSNSELLAILVRTGTRDQSAVDLSRRIFERFSSFREMCRADLQAWSGLKGVGPVKIAQIKAAIEIGRRFREEQTRCQKPQIQNARDIIDVLMPRMRDLPKEVFKLIPLDSQNRVIDILEVTQGTVNMAVPVIREIFELALRYHAVSVICVHNHPSGNVKPSSEDCRFTRELYQAGQVMQIYVLDHIIIGDNAYYSFADEGRLRI
jgi:DNA repair protein RadC